MLKLLHTADWHVGRTFGQGFDPAAAQKLARDRLSVIDRILGLAEHFDVHAVLCAGDLFEDPKPAEDWWRGLAETFIRRRNWKRPVVLLPGNHDPLTEDSVYSRMHGFRRALPDWVRVVDQDDFELPIAGGEAVVYAAPCRSMAGDRDLAMTLPRRGDRDTRFRIGLAHGSTFDSPDHPANFPVSPNAPQERGLDYLALGDIHNFIDDGNTAPIVYPSAPEPTSFGEPEAGYVALVWFTRRGVRPQIFRERVARWTWEQVTVKSLEELRDLAARDLFATVLRLRLELRFSLAELDEVTHIVASLRGTDAVSARTGAFLCEPEDPNGLVASGAIDLDRMPAAVRETVDALTQEGGPEAMRALAELQRLLHEVDRVILLSLEVENFRVVRAARLTFAGGLNVLYGPNDIGKSTLVEALRVAFLLSPQSAACADFRPWGTDQTPRVVVEFKLEGVVWRITKEFATARRGTALLERKSDGEDWREEATDRAVESKLREIIAWGIPSPGGRGAPRGLPESYLATALLGSQDAVTMILNASPEDDGTESGKKLITQALGAIGRDPRVGGLLERLQEDVDRVFTETGQLRRRADSPIASIQQQRENKRNELEALKDLVRKSGAIEAEILKLREREIALKRRVELLRQVKSATEMVESLRQDEDALNRARRDLDQAERDLAESEAKFQRTDDAKRQAEQNLQQAREKRDKLAGALETKARDQQQTRENRRQELELKRQNALQDIKNASDAKQAEALIADCERKVQRLEEESKLAKRYESHAGAFAALTELLTVQQRARALREATTHADAAEADVRKAEATLADAERVFKTRAAEADAAATRIAEYEHRIASLRIQERETHQSIGRINAVVNAATRLEQAASALRELEEEERELEARLDANTNEREACERQRQAQLPWPIAPALLGGSVCAGLSVAFGFGLSFSLPLLAVVALVFFAIATAAAAFFLRHRKRQQAVEAVEREFESLEKAREKHLEKRNFLAAKHPGAQNRVESAQGEYELVVAQANVPNFNRANADAVLKSLQSEVDRIPTDLAQVQDRFTLARTGETVDLDKFKRDIEAAQAAVDPHRRERDRRNTARIAAQEQFKIALQTLNDEQSMQLYLGALGGGSPSECATPVNLRAELDKSAIENEAKLLPVLAVEMRRSEAALQKMLAPSELGQAPAGIDRQTEEYRFLSRISRQIEIVMQHARHVCVSLTPELARQIESLQQQLRDALKQAGGELATVSARHLLEALQRLKMLFAQRGVELDTNLANGNEQLSSAKSAAERARSSLNASADDALREAEKTLNDVEQKLVNVDAECDSELSDTLTEADVAGAEAERVQDKCGQAVQARDTVSQERDRMRQRRDAAAKLVEELCNVSVATSLPDAQDKLERVRIDFAVESNGLSLPDSSTGIGALLEREEAELRAMRDKLTEKRGELNHVGGIVFRERQDREQETYNRLVKRAEDLELEYRAKLRLFITLKDAEEKQSTHLGRILAGPVSAIFAELTADRYSQLVLDSGLRFQHVVAMKGERQVQSLSVGTRDQLATLVRLAIAAHLRTALVLDDQLTQSDACAMRWFRDRLREVRDRGHQVVVVTCHPEDYLDPEEMPASGDRRETPDEMVTAADLTQLLSRR